MNTILIIIGLVIIISALSVRISEHFKIPILVVYICLGIILGEHGIHALSSTSYSFIQSLGIISLCYILFSGALETKMDSIKEVATKGILLSTLGVVITTSIVALFTHFLINFSWSESFLLGAIISSTDAAAVISILNFSTVKIPYKLQNLLKLESGSNDPMAYSLLILILSFSQSSGVIGNTDIFMALLNLIVNIVVGFFSGIIFGKLSLLILDHFSSKIFELDHILIFGLVTLTFGTTNLIHGNSFLAIYIFGLYLGKGDFKYKKNTIRFYSTISWFMQICMFIALGLLANPTTLSSIWKQSLIICFILMFIARPLAIYICLSYRKATMNHQSKIFLSWGGLKGAVPVIFATYPIVANIPKAEEIFHIVFFVVLLSVLIQGNTLDLLSKKLNFTVPHSESNTYNDVALDRIEGLESKLIETKVLPHSFFKEKVIKDLNLPTGSYIISINRDNQYITPNAETTIQENDILFFISSNKTEFIQNFLSKIQS